MSSDVIDPFDGYDQGGETAAFYAAQHDDDDYILPPQEQQGGECRRCGGSGLIYRRGPGTIPDTCSCRAGQQAANQLSIG